MRQFIAESGVSTTLAYLRDNKSWRTQQVSGTWVNSQKYAGGTFNVIGEDGVDEDGDGNVDGDGDLADDATDPLTLTVTGEYSGVTHVIHVTVHPTSSGAGKSVTATTSVYMKDGTIDSFNSNIGPYGGSNIGQDAVVTTNSTSSGTVDLNSTATIKGTVKVGVGGDPAQVIAADDGVTITGGTGTLSEEGTVESIAPPDLGANQGDVVYENGVHTLSQDVHSAKFYVKNDAVLKISGDRRVVCERLVISDLAQVKFSPKATLTVWADQSTFSGTSRTNLDTGDPSRFTLYAQTSDIIDVQDSVQVYGQVVAEEGMLWVTNFAEFFGGFSGESLKVTGEGQFHHDVAGVDNSGSGGGTSRFTTIWSE